MKFVTNRIFLTVLAGFGALIMTASGLVKILNTEFRTDMTNTYEISGGWFYVLVGLFELAIALLLVMKDSRVLGGIALAGLMAGALIFNLFLVVDVLPEGVQDPTNFWPVNIALALLGAAIAEFWPKAQAPLD